MGPMLWKFEKGMASQIMRGLLANVVYVPDDRDHGQWLERGNM